MHGTRLRHPKGYLHPQPTPNNSGAMSARCTGTLNKAANSGKKTQKHTLHLYNVIVAYCVPDTITLYGLCHSLKQMDAKHADALKALHRLWGYKQKWLAEITIKFYFYFFVSKGL